MLELSFGCDCGSGKKGFREVEERNSRIRTETCQCNMEIYGANMGHALKIDSFPPSGEGKARAVERRR